MSIVLTLGDDSQMPFGKHKGKPMADVPVDYLHWLWQAGKKHDKFCPVANYIRNNLTALQDEQPDLIWD